MVEDGVYCCGHRPDLGKHIIQGTFEIEHSPWLCLSATARSLAIRICSQKGDPSTEKGLKSKNADMMQGKVLRREKKPIMKGKLKLPTRIIKFSFKFQVVPEFGPPGAFVMENKDKHEFFLKSTILQYIFPATSDKNKFHFYCNSWVYPFKKIGVKRVFFLNELYLPRETPVGLVKLRRKELQKLRGSGSNDERKPYDRIYEYDKYNDLGDPDNGQEYARPVLGGSSEFPYPRRLRTGRPHCHHDHSIESQPASCFQTYVPPDERMSHEKQEELRNNFVDALVRFLSPKQNQPPGSYQEFPDFIKKFVHFFVPSAAFSVGDFKFILSIINFFRRKPKSSSSDQETQSFDYEEEIYDIFAEKEVKEMEEWKKQKLKKFVPNEIFNEVVATTATKRNLEDSQLPSIIAEQRDAWKHDKEFGRQLLAGTNPVRIQRLKEFSPLMNEIWELMKERIWESKKEEILKEMEKKEFESEFRKEIEELIRRNKMFILEHHDYLQPFLNMINGKGVCAYATRTLLYVEWLGTIRPIGIELSLPESTMVIVPPYSSSSNDDSDSDNRKDDSDDGFRWELAKIHVAANDAAYHQLVSHWLHTHAVIEPFIIATRRQLSMIHPIHRLLDPHLKDTLHINALARGMFLNAGGILEKTLFTGEFSMWMSSHLYKQWRFDEQTLPIDLWKRDAEKLNQEKIADKKPLGRDAKPEEIIRGENISHFKEEPDEPKPEEIINKKLGEEGENPTGMSTKMMEFVLEDYPYGDDGTEIWEAIERWVSEYCKIFYVEEDNIVKADERVREDEEIQAWWSEIRNEGHGDQKEGWYDLRTLQELVKALTTIIWITSGLHAAVNFGQYAYAGWPPNRPMLLRKFIPKPGTEECKEAKQNRGKFIAEMMPEKFEMEFVIAVMDFLSRHTSDEVYLGQGPLENTWEERQAVNNKFEEFKERLEEIDKKIKESNRSYGQPNRWGDAKIPYKLLDPDTPKTKASSKGKDKQGYKIGITGMGIPNSISI